MKNKSDAVYEWAVEKMEKIFLKYNKHLIKKFAECFDELATIKKIADDEIKRLKERG